MQETKEKVTIFKTDVDGFQNMQFIVKGVIYPDAKLGIKAQKGKYGIFKKHVDGNGYLVTTDEETISAIKSHRLFLNGTVFETDRVGPAPESVRVIQAGDSVAAREPHIPAPEDKGADNGPVPVPPRRGRPPLNRE